LAETHLHLEMVVLVAAKAHILVALVVLVAKQQ
jgi:hypothetical protein